MFLSDNSNVCVTAVLVSVDDLFQGIEIFLIINVPRNFRLHSADFQYYVVGLEVLIKAYG